MQACFIQAFTRHSFFYKRTDKKCSQTAFAAGLQPLRLLPRATARSSQQASVATSIMCKQGRGPRLTVAARLEILALLAAPVPSSRQQLVHQFGVSEAMIRHVKANSAAI